MKHKIWYDNDRGILFLEFKSDYLQSDVPIIRGKMIELLDGKPYRQMVIEMSKTHKVENRKTRELSNQAMKDAKITDAAFVGGSAANRMIAKVLLKTGALKTKGDFFKTKEDALKWILSKRNGD